MILPPIAVSLLQERNLMKQTLFIILFLTVAIIFYGCRNQEVPAATAETLTISESTANTEMAAATESADEDTVYYGQGEISPDDIIRVPSSTVEIPDEEAAEINN